MSTFIQVRLVLKSSFLPRLFCRFVDKTSRGLNEEIRMLLLLQINKTQLPGVLFNSQENYINQQRAVRFKLVQQDHKELYDYFKFLPAHLRSAEIYRLLSEVDGSHNETSVSYSPGLHNIPDIQVIPEEASPGLNETLKISQDDLDLIDEL